MELDPSSDILFGNDLYQAIKANDLEKVTNFIDAHGVDAKFRFEENTGMGEWMRGSTVLLASIIAGNDEVAKHVIERGAKLLVGEYNIPALELSCDTHPLIAAIGARRSEILPVLVDAGIDFNVMLDEVAGSGQSRCSLKEAVRELEGVEDYLSSLNIGHILDESYGVASVTISGMRP